ncbi:MAG: ribosome small subunit-dependent GTPase A [Pseudomonadales bacterium]
MTPTLRALGWSAFFQQQLDPDEAATLVPARVVAVERSGLTLQFDGGEVTVPLGGRWFQLEAEDRPTIGDWVLLNARRDTVERLLGRKSLLKRVAAGRASEVQLLAANVDTVFLVTSCNEDFNPSRLERYLALALDSGVQPVVVLTKRDLTTVPEDFVAAVRRLSRDVPVELVDARDPVSLAGVRAWCGEGQTVALLGSSGVGKSTLVNSLSGDSVQLTQDIREDDAKGRHTTTSRSLHRLPDGGLIVDSPGMRELALGDVEEGVRALFEDIDALAARCRFRDCAHQGEPGCAVRAAIEAGELDERRLDSYRKLQREEAYNSESIAERHARVRAFSRMVKQHQKTSQKNSD